MCHPAKQHTNITSDDRNAKYWSHMQAIIGKYHVTHDVGHITGHVYIISN